MPGTLHRAEKKRVSSEGRMDVAKVIRSVVIHGQPKGNVCLPHISDILENIHNLHNFGSGNVSFS